MSAARTNPEQRAAALEVYRQHGLAEAHRQSGVPKSTLRDWARAEGLDTAALSAEVIAQVDAANLAREARIVQLRAELREELLLAAADMTERLRAPHKDFKGKDMIEVQYDHAPADACRNYAVAAAVFIDKFRLESGESTGHVSVDHGPVEQQKQRVGRLRDELAERRAKAS